MFDSFVLDYNMEHVAYNALTILGQERFSSGKRLVASFHSGGANSNKQIKFFPPSN